ncbi:MAG: hypothetical protein DME02_07570 [Candidatus Rokuibacteriota bacterium]|nr:MAG: hypothetical protein DME02_07570 [Candidatus Rokubacteria bacterium]
MKTTRYACDTNASSSGRKTSIRRCSCKRGATAGIPHGDE